MPKKPTRDQLATFLKTQELIKAFEGLFDLTGGDSGEIAALQLAVASLSTRLTTAENELTESELNALMESARSGSIAQALGELAKAVDGLAMAPVAIPYIAPTVTPGGSGNAVNVVCDFGASFTDKAQTVVTGEAWVTGTSVLNAEVLTNSGTDPDEMFLLGIRAVVSDIVPGDGFTITLYSEAEARGTYTVMVSGV